MVSQDGEAGLREAVETLARFEDMARDGGRPMVATVSRNLARSMRALIEEARASSVSQGDGKQGNG
jgi:hypothetical protein